MKIQKLLMLAFALALFAGCAKKTDGAESSMSPGIPGSSESPEAPESSDSFEATMASKIQVIYPAENEGELYGLEMSDYESGQSISNTIKALATGERKTIVAYGTSLTALPGWVDAFKAVMAFKYGKNALVVNSAVSATDSNWGLQNIASRVLVFKPDLVFIEFGINDAYLEREITQSGAKQNLLDMINAIYEVNPDCEIVIMTMDIPLDGHFTARPEFEQYYDVYREVAAETGVILVDNHAAWKELLDESEEGYRNLVPDGIHPSQAGHERVTLSAILDVLYDKR